MSNTEKNTQNTYENWADFYQGEMNLSTFSGKFDGKSNLEHVGYIVWGQWIKYYADLKVLLNKTKWLKFKVFCRICEQGFDIYSQVESCKNPDWWGMSWFQDADKARNKV